MQKFNKLCRFSRICSVGIIRHQRFCFMGAIKMKQPSKDPLRCIYILEKEHSFIRSTLQSFESLLTAIKQEGKNKDMLEYINDYKQFTTFFSQYNPCHTSKEDILFNYAKYKCTYSDALKTKTDYAYNLFESAISDKKSLEVIPSKQSMAKLHKIMEEEQNKIFPAIINQLAPTEMEELSEEFDCCDDENEALLKNLEFISAELTAKY